MMNCVKTLISLILTLTISSTVVAQDEWEPPIIECPGDLRVIVVEEGEPVEFSGQLFTNDAASCLLIQNEATIEAARLELGYTQELWEIELASCESESEIRVDSLNQQIVILEDSLEEALERSWWDTPIFYVSVGVILGGATGFLIGNAL